MSISEKLFKALKFADLANSLKMGSYKIRNDRIRESRPCHQRMVFCASKNYEQRQLLILSTSSCFHSSGILQQLLLSRHVFAGRNSAAQVVLASNIKIAKRGHQEGASLFQKKVEVHELFTPPLKHRLHALFQHEREQQPVCVCVCVCVCCH